MGRGKLTMIVYKISINNITTSPSYAIGDAIILNPLYLFKLYNRLHLK